MAQTTPPRKSGHGEPGPLLVDVPDAFAPLFTRAQEYVNRYFSQREEDPRKSTISICGERYILVRAASMSVEFFELVLSLYRNHPTEQAWAVAANLLFDIAHAIGKADAREMHQKMSVTDPVNKLSAGPIHFAHTGWAFVRILPESHPTPDEHFYLLYDHIGSFESDSWLKRGKEARLPVCVMNAGYSSGWCEESFGLPLASVEVECRARGDEHCRFIMAPPARIEHYVDAFRAKSGPNRGKVWSPSTAIEIPEFFQRKRLEEELRASHELLEQRVRERTAQLEAANAALELQIEERKRLQVQLLHAQKLESVGRLAGAVAHDFNNHLTAIMGYLALAEGECNHATQMSQHLSAIGDAATRAANLIQQLLAFARKQVIEPRNIDIGQLIRGMHRMLQALLGDMVMYKLHIPDNLWPVRADPTQVEQVVVNLAVNARDAMRQGGEVVIELANSPDTRIESLRPGDYVRLSVTDSGVGMTEEVRSRVFEPFFTTKAPGIGTGLGLATCYGIATQSGGGIRVESTLGKGTRFDVFLPRAVGEAETAPAPPPAAPAHLTRTHPAVLLVEDSEIVRDVTARLLRGMGYRVILAPDGENALELFAKHRSEISLVLSDILMPGIDGRELAQRIHQVAPRLPVVLMSGYVPMEGGEGPAMPANVPFLRKPFAPAQLAQTLADSLRV